MTAKQQLLTPTIIISRTENYFAFSLNTFFSYSKNKGKHTLLLPQKFTLRLRILTNNVSQVYQQTEVHRSTQVSRLVQLYDKYVDFAGI